MNRRFLLNSLFLLPFSNGCSLDIEEILGAKPKTPLDNAIPEWPFRAITLSPAQKLMWEDYHKHPYNLFVTANESERTVAENISELYIGKLTQITRSGVRICSNGKELIIDNLDFNNHPIDDSIWQGLFLDKFPEKFGKVTIFTEMDFPNHFFLKGLSDSGKFNVKIFSLEEEPSTNSKIIGV